MLEIFQEIGMERSLLILGAPGSGKTTMLLELACQLIMRAREDITEPIPVVFNLSSWTEELTLADWLEKELNAIYYVPEKTALTWVKENKMLLLLDGLDEVKQASRSKCVNAINQFRKESGLTNIVVCSRIQDYAELKIQLSFEGAIEIQPLTSKQVNAYFKRFGKGLSGIRQLLEKDTTMYEMAETPLFLSIMTLAYRDTQSKDILVSANSDVQRKHLFNIYIERMFERPERSRKVAFKKQDVLHWLAWLAHSMVKHNSVPYFLENMKIYWWTDSFFIWAITRHLTGGVIYGLIGGLCSGLVFGLMDKLKISSIIVLWNGFSLGLCFWAVYGIIYRLDDVLFTSRVDYSFSWSWLNATLWQFLRLIFWLMNSLIYGLVGGLVGGLGEILIMWLRGGTFLTLSGGDSNVQISTGIMEGWKSGAIFGVKYGMAIGVILSLTNWLIVGLMATLDREKTSQAPLLRQSFSLTVKSSLLGTIYFGLLFGLSFAYVGGLNSGLIGGVIGGLTGGLAYGGIALIKHYTLQFILGVKNYFPFRLAAFLDYCVDHIFLRRVGGGYIFIHRLLMEHFAAMYQEE